MESSISTTVIALASVISAAIGAFIGWFSSQRTQKREHGFRKKEWLKNIYLKDVEKLSNGLANQYISMSTNLDIYYREIKEVRKVFPVYLYDLEMGRDLLGDEGKILRDQSTVENLQEKVLGRKLKQDFPSIDTQFDHRDKILDWFDYDTFWIPSEYENNWKSHLKEFKEEFTTILRQQRELIEECKTQMNNIVLKRAKNISSEDLRIIESKILDVERRYHELLDEKKIIGKKIKNFRKKMHTELNYRDL